MKKEFLRRGWTINFLLATNIDGFKEEFSKKFKDQNIYKYDLSSFKDVEEFLSKNKNYDYLITSEKILNDITLDEYIRLIKKKNSKINIIYLAEKISLAEKNILFKYNVFNILEGIKIDFNSLNDIIYNNKNIIYQSNSNIKNSKIISVFGTSGSGKSTISYAISKEISNYKKTLLLDLDIQNSCVDIYASEKEKNKNILDIIEELELCKDKEYIKECIYRKDKLDYIFSNLSLYETQSKLDISKYESLLKYSIENYEFTFVDLTNCLFIDQIKYFLVNSTEILFVINPNYISLRQAIKYLELINQLWKIPRFKVKIVINKVSNKSLSKNNIQNILGKYKIYDIISFNSKVEESINSGSTLNLNCCFDKILEYFCIDRKKKNILNLKKVKLYD